MSVNSLPHRAGADELARMQRLALELAEFQVELTHLGLSPPGLPGMPAVDSDAMQVSLLTGICRILECEYSALVLLSDPDDGWMVSKSLSGNSEWVYQIHPCEGPGLVRESLRTLAPIRVDNPTADPRYEPAGDGIGELPVRSFLCVPVLAGDRAIGAIKALNHLPDPFDDYDQELLLILAAQASNILRAVREIQELKIANADLEAGHWELLSSRNTLRALFDHLPASLYIIDGDYQLAAVNRSRAQRLGVNPRSLVGQTCYKALFGRSDPCPECRVQETLRAAHSTQRTERRYGAGDEATEWEISTHPILSDEDEITQAILLESDVTERRRLESILTQSEKLAAIGQLAAGVAHEINNPLTAIIANAQILHRELPASSDLQESVDSIARAGARATQVVRNLLDFARKEEVHLGLTDVNETIERALELIQHEIVARGARLDFAPDPTLPPILASQDHLQSVWLNLLLNAIDSLDKSPAEIKILSRKVGSEIHVQVSDNGKGIPADRLTRIFEPFYTTKAAGRGTGLGLSVSHRIVKQHNGRIAVESQVGSGSVFTVMLPVT